MPNLNQIIEKFARRPKDVVALDCVSDALRVVRMRRQADKIVLVGADVLPPSMHLGEQPLTAEDIDGIRAPALPPRLRGRYASLALSGRHAVIKLLRLPGSFDASDQEQVASKMGLEDPENYRVAARPLSAAIGRGEARALAVALPEIEAQALLCLTPSGLPAPYALTVSELAVVDAFLHGPGATSPEQAMGMIHFDQDRSIFALFNRGVLSQLRTFGFGLAAILHRICSTLGIDRDTAEGIVADGAFEISHLAAEELRMITKQLVICRDFMERSENCQLGQLHLSGAAALVNQFSTGIQTGMNLVEWKVLAPWVDDEVSVLPEALAGKAWCLAAGVGACLRILEKS